MTKKEENQNGFSYEETIETIENVLNELDNKDIPLDMAISKYKEGLELVKICNEALDKVEKELTIIEEKNQ